MKKKFVCTIWELAKRIEADAVRYHSSHYGDKSKVPSYDFAFVDEDECSHGNEEEIVNNAEGWYGIHVVDTGFDNDDPLYVSDYYGGGAECTYLCDDCEISYNNVKEKICNMIMGTLSMEYDDVQPDWKLVVEMESTNEDDEEAGEEEEQYITSSYNGDYSPSNPWDAPGMSIHDFI